MLLCNEIKSKLLLINVILWDKTRRRQRDTRFVLRDYDFEMKLCKIRTFELDIITNNSKRYCKVL